MNRWLEMSIRYANQRNYLDDLFRVYPLEPDGIRDIEQNTWSLVEQAFHERDNKNLIFNLLHMDLFPIKDSYVAYLKRDPRAIDRNPQTVNRIAGRLYEMGLDKVYDNCTQPKETNRQMGPCFKAWLNRQGLGIAPVPIEKFMATKENAVLDAGDNQMKEWAKRHLGYSREKGLDLLARFNGRYVIGEAKFLTDIGGHQNAQFEDAISTLKAAINDDVVRVAILDGVLYIPNRGKMYRTLTNDLEKYNVMSALVLRDFLYSL